MATPVLLSSLPENSSTGVAINPRIRLIFDVLDPSQVTPGRVILSPLAYSSKPEELEFVVTQLGDGTWALDIYPAYTLNDNTQYKIIIKKEALTYDGDETLYDEIVYFITGTHTEVNQNEFSNPWDTTGFPYVTNIPIDTSTKITSSSPNDGAYNLQLRADLGLPYISNQIDITLSTLVGNILPEHIKVEVEPIDWDPRRPHDAPTVNSVSVINDYTIRIVFNTYDKCYHVTTQDKTKEVLETQGSWDENTRVRITILPNTPILPSGTLDKELSIEFTTAYFPLFSRVKDIERRALVFIKKLGYTESDILYAIFMESDYLTKALVEMGKFSIDLIQFPTNSMIGWVRCAVVKKLMEEAILNDYMGMNGGLGKVLEKQLADFRIQFQSIPQDGPIAKIIDRYNMDIENCLRGNWIDIFHTVALTGAVQGARAYHPQRLYIISNWTRWRSYDREAHYPGPQVDYNPIKPTSYRGYY